MNTSNASNPDLIYRSGYDIPLYGLANGQLLNIHIPALVLISVSFICVLTVIGLSFCRQSWKTFFKWTRSERFVVYLALCDGSFNVSHFTDHMHIVIAKRHVYPKALCEFYGFNLAVFVTAQILMVNAVAVNAFLLIYFNKQIPIGKRDYRLLLWTFGLPFVGSIFAALFDQLGPNGVLYVYVAKSLHLH